MICTNFDYRLHKDAGDQPSTVLESKVNLNARFIRTRKKSGEMIRQEDTKLTKLFVGGIPYDTDDDSLRDFFLQFGEIKEAVVIRDRDTLKSKGYGFVSVGAFDL